MTLPKILAGRISVYIGKKSFFKINFFLKYQHNTQHHEIEIIQVQWLAVAHAHKRKRALAPKEMPWKRQSMTPCFDVVILPYPHYNHHSASVFRRAVLLLCVGYSLCSSAVFSTYIIGLHSFIVSLGLSRTSHDNLVSLVNMSFTCVI